MRFGLMSDLHLEFGYLPLPGGDTLVLAGDIAEIRTIVRDHKCWVDDGCPINMPGKYVAWDFVRYELAKYKNVLWVFGNHEFYNSEFNSARDELNNLLIAEELTHIRVLENSVVDIEGVKFIGCTLWTDMNKGDAITLASIKRMMNDYRCIKHHGGGVWRKLDPIDTVKCHQTSVEYLKQELSLTTANDRVVLVTHHAPSTASIHPEYRRDIITNGAYASDLSELILDHPQILACVHGHIHYAQEYLIGSTRVISNPRGYDGYESDTGFRVDRVVEV